MKSKLHHLIFVGMGLGVLLGIALWNLDPSSDFYLNTVWVLDLVGKTIFVGALKMLVAPLIFASIIAGVTSLPSSKDLGDLGWKTLAYYLVTTSVAAFIGLVLVSIVRPGHWEASQAISSKRASHLATIEESVRSADAKKEASLKGALQGEALKKELASLSQSFDERFLFAINQQEEASLLSNEDFKNRFQKIQEKKQSPLNFIKDIFAGMIQNPFRSLTFSSSLGIIFFAILMGLACTAVGAEAKPVVEVFQAFNSVIMKLTMWVMLVSPVAVFCLMASLISQSGPEIFETLAGYIFTVILGIVIHFVVLLTICKYVGGLSPIKFLKGLQDAWLIAFSTRSSAATLPVTISCVEKNFGVPKRISEFVLPIGATVNMDGTALYEGVAVIFLLQMFGPMADVDIALGFVPMVLIFITAVLASVGAAAVPDAGLITMVLVATAVGLPEYYLVFVFSVDAFLDMFRTSTNITGDAVGAVVMSRIYERSTA
jgi:Na+/H+-dicarboxylate symporter